MRVSDAEREQAAAELRRHMLAGRLTLEEFSARLDEVYDARTRTELERVTRELPPVAAEPSVREARRWAVTIMGGLSRRERWRVPRKVNIVAVMGGAHVDFRRAELTADPVRITAVAWMGGIDLVFPPGVDVDVRGFALFGGRANLTRAPERVDAPRALVRAFAFAGGVSARTGSGVSPPRPNELPS